MFNHVILKKIHMTFFSKTLANVEVISQKSNKKI